MKVLVIGSGGREHAIVDALTRSQQVEQIYAAPGNAGMAAVAECVAIRETEIERLVAFAKEQAIGLTVVGPEVALAAGVADAFKAEGLRIFGPTKAAARIESSKEFAKCLMAKYNVPTAGFKAFTDYEEALAYVAGRSFPAVLKYDGLAAGKGVVIAQTLDGLILVSVLEPQMAGIQTSLIQRMIDCVDHLHHLIAVMAVPRLIPSPHIFQQERHIALFQRRNQLLYIVNIELHIFVVRHADLTAARMIRHVFHA